MNLLTLTLLWSGLSLIGSVALIDLARKIQKTPEILNWYAKNMSDNSRQGLRYASVANNQSFLMAFSTSLLLWWWYVINWIIIYVWAIKISFSKK